MKILIAVFCLSFVTPVFASSFECTGRDKNGKSFIVRYSPNSINVTVVQNGYPVDNGTNFSVYDWKKSKLKIEASGYFRPYLLSPIDYVHVSIQKGEGRSKLYFGEDTLLNGTQWGKPLVMSCP